MPVLIRQSKVQLGSGLYSLVLLQSESRAVVGQVAVVVDEVDVVARITTREVTSKTDINVTLSSTGAFP